MDVIGYLALMVLGLVLGTLGMGGAILAIPILVHVFSLNMVTASAYALFITGATSLLGYALKLRDHLVDMRTTMFFGLPSIITIFVTRKWIVETIPTVISFGGVGLKKDVLLSMTLCVFMIVSSLLMIRQSKISSVHVRSRVGLLFPAGIFIGFVAGLVGAGGGFLILPSLVILGRLPFAMAVGTTLMLVSLNSLGGFCGDVFNYAIEWPFLIRITSFCMAGLFAGYFSKDILSRFLNAQTFGWVMAMAGVATALIELFGQE